MFHRKHKDLALNEYLPFILNDAKTRKIGENMVKLFTVDTYQGSWTSVNLDHPATFTTLAMETDMKEKVMKNLDRFVKRIEFYWKVGKAWKKGTCCMVPRVRGNQAWLLVAMSNRSIFVVEDIDCFVELHDREDVTSKELVQDEQVVYHRITLSGFLNFIDGLWSSCGDERIIIFTTNRKEKLDPALLRAGRMDVQINMSYCTVSGFRLLASNYLGIVQHNLFEEIEDLIGEACRN
ncbi:putative ATPase, AAA-type, core, P-loop containing nucleoside triphosphate hydrolase [Helianthus debilis subsp. tardiflorus]